jgi:hypothetical protein
LPLDRDPSESDGTEDHMVIDLELIGNAIDEVNRFRDSGD